MECNEDIVAKRIEVLQDAIAQLKAENYTAKQGWYFAGPSSDANRGRSSREVLSQNGCTVCANGALLVSAIRKNKDIPYWMMSNDNCKPQLEKQGLWSKDQMAMMENAFEGTHWAQLHDARLLSQAAKQFNAKLVGLSSKDRMIKIFENAIRNGGEFKPELEE